MAARHPDPALERMVARQIASRGIDDPRVLAAMRRVPRRAFVSGDLEEFSSEDSPLPIACGQTISQPFIVALMTQAAAVGAQDQVLDVGTGSGYAAAVLAELARHVTSVERHRELVDTARERLRWLGYDNVDVHHGDGTRGWPPAAPFDAIVVAAAPGEVPRDLLEQLRVGGRLIIPVGARGHQQLLRITRRGEDDWATDELGAVTFVPLVADPEAAAGAPRGPREAPAADPGQADSALQEPAATASEAPTATARMAATPPRATAPSAATSGATSAATSAAPVPVRSAARDIAAAAHPLPPVDEEAAFARAFDRYADRRVVLLGEASHGTAEFHRARAAITRRLVEHHGFTIVAAEADWPDAMAVNRAVRGQPGTHGEIRPFTRFPTWMWRNQEVADFWRWMAAFNTGRDEASQVGFYGLDLYNLRASIATVLSYLESVDREAAEIARERYACLMPFRAEPARYGRMASRGSYEQCEAAVNEMLRDMLVRSEAQRERDDPLFDATQSARLVANAEEYYRRMYFASRESWNLRDSHMFETLDALLRRRPGEKVVVWAHNSHIGDARATEMGRVRGEHNIGQLCREAYGDAAASIGFGTHTGTVAAADDWDGPMKIKTVLPSRAESCERLCHDTGVARFLLEGERAPEALRTERLERFIGVIYRPETELWSHYAEAVLAEQFDGWVWFDETRAITSLATETGAGPEETFPFGT